MCDTAHTRRNHYISKKKELETFANGGKEVRKLRCLCGVHIRQMLILPYEIFKYLLLFMYVCMFVIIILLHLPNCNTASICIMSCYIWSLLLVEHFMLHYLPRSVCKILCPIISISSWPIVDFPSLFIA